MIQYFRIDLAGAPGDGAKDYSFLYGIYIDSRAGGVDGPISAYIPDTLAGIDQIVDSHYNPYWGKWFQDDYHYGLTAADPVSWSLG